MTKRILVALLTFLMILSSLTSFYSADTTERNALQAVPSTLGESFTLPLSPSLEDPAIVFGALEHAAAGSGVNLFRTTVGYNQDDQPYFTHYVFLTSENTGFFEPFRLLDGRFLSPAETQEGAHFLSTGTNLAPEQVGILDDIGHNDLMNVYGLLAAFDSLPTAGNYVIEYEAVADLNNFYSLLVTALAQSGADITLEDLNPGSGTQAVGGQLDNEELRNWAIIGAALIAIAILIIFRQLYESKRTAILLLHGNSTLQAWFRVTGKTILTTMAVLLVASTLFSFFIPGVTTELVGTTIANAALVTVFALLASLITLPYIRFMKQHEALKNRKDTRLLTIANLSIKFVLIIVLIITGTSCVARFESVTEAESRLGSWEQTSQYGVFYPRYVGADFDELTSGQRASTATEVYHLYPALNERGALYIDASFFEPISLEQELYPGMYRSLKVNPNYLLEYPIVGADGEHIIISEDETDWILLVPESYKSEEEAILKSFQTSREGDELIESVWVREQRLFGSTASQAIQEQKVKIIWTANNQSVFSFNPSVYPDDGNNILDPIVEVMTVGNSVGPDRYNGFSGDIGTCVKIKLIEGDTKKTMEELKALLEELHLDDNLRHIVTLNDYALLELQMWQQALQDTIARGLVILALFLIFAVQSAVLLFEQNARRVAVRKLLGYSFFSRHRRFFSVFLITWLCTLVALTPIRFLFSGHLDLPQNGLLALCGVAGVFALLELLIASIVLIYVENRRLSDILKGDF